MNEPHCPAMGPTFTSVSGDAPVQTLWISNEAWSWNSRTGFVYDECPHRKPACFRCRVRWLIHLWRTGNRIWYLP